MRAHTLVLVLGLGAGASALAEAPGVSLAQADALARKLHTILSGNPAARRKPLPPLSVTEDELNSYVAYKLRAQIPPGVSDVRVRLERDRLGGGAVVDFDQLKDKLPPFGPLNPLSLLSGRVPTQFRGRLPNDDGFGTFELEELSLGALPVPIALVAQAVARSTRTAERPDGVDLNAPFRLPWGVKRVRLQPGRAVLEY